MVITKSIHKFFITITYHVHDISCIIIQNITSIHREIFALWVEFIWMKWLTETQLCLSSSGITSSSCTQSVSFSCRFFLAKSLVSTKESNSSCSDNLHVLNEHSVMKSHTLKIPTPPAVIIYMYLKSILSDDISHTRIPNFPFTMSLALHISFCNAR